MANILPGAPWLIAHRSMLGINQPNKITLNSRDYVLWQNKEGEVFALDNICPHMQAPLSNGWICEAPNSIVCPFHALKFDGQGRLLKDDIPGREPVAKPLDLIIQGDLIWSYGGFKPHLPIPDLIPRHTEELDFLGVAGNKSIQASFLNCLKINYDFNHQNGTHRQSFRIRKNSVDAFEEEGYHAKVVQTFFRENNTFMEILKNPALLSTPITYKSDLEYTFPATTMFRAQVDFGEIPQFYILYPETENRTRTFVLCYGKWKNALFKLPILRTLAQQALLQATEKVVEQDSITVESLYSQQKPKVRLPKEEILAYVEKLYNDWGSSS